MECLQGRNVTKGKARTHKGYMDLKSLLVILKNILRFSFFFFLYNYFLMTCFVYSTTEIVIDSR